MALLLSQASISVDNLDVKLGSTLNDGLSLLGRDVVGNLGSVSAVVHKKDLEVVGVVHSELLEAGLQDVLGDAVSSITDLGHAGEALELAAKSVINTLGLSPVLIELVVAVRLVALEGVGLLLDDRLANKRLDHLLPYSCKH